MSESQQGPEICDVISARRYWLCSRIGRALVRLFCTKDAKQLSADRFYSRDQTGNSIKFLVTKESFYAKNKINPQRLF